LEDFYRQIHNINIQFKETGDLLLNDIGCLFHKIIFKSLVDNSINYNVKYNDVSIDLKTDFIDNRLLLYYVFIHSVSDIDYWDEFYNKVDKFKYKIFIPPKNTNITSREYESLKYGLEHNSNVVTNIPLNDADIIIQTSTNNMNIDSNFLFKTVVVDNNNEGNKLLCNPDNALLYFKRNCMYYFDGKWLNCVNKIPKIIPMLQPLRNDVLSFKIRQSIKRDIDILYLFDYKNDINRNNVLTFIKNSEKLKGYRVYTGSINPLLKIRINDRYLHMLRRAKITIVCTPMNYDSDYRTLEAMYSGSCVLQNAPKSNSVFVNNFEHGKHLFYYNLNNLYQLEELIISLLGNDEVRHAIANNGNDFVLKYHKPQDRINEIIDNFNKNVIKNVLCSELLN